MEFRVDGLPVELNAWQDLAWLKRFGRVFKVFDRLVSGNLCFGVQAGNERFFVKYAGARTLLYAGSPETAVLRLRKAGPLYGELAHPALSPLLYESQTPEGHALVFPWFDGYPLGPLPGHLEALRELPLISRLTLYDTLADFIALASTHDCIAGGIWDNGILVRLTGPKALFCSVNHYLRMPARTPWGKLPGSPWYVPPEGYHSGAILSETANVYAMGALAFTFFGNRDTRSPQSWEAGDGTRRAALQAVSHEPAARFQTARAFLTAWRAAVMQTNLKTT